MADAKLMAALWGLVADWETYSDQNGIKASESYDDGDTEAAETEGFCNGMSEAADRLTAILTGRAPEVAR